MVLTAEKLYGINSVNTCSPTDENILDSHLNMAKVVCEFDQSKDTEYNYRSMKNYEDIDLLILEE